jgi:hypothetical protein
MLELEVSKYVLFTLSDPQFCEFCTTQNTESLVLRFLHSGRVQHSLPLEFLFIIF